MFASQLRPYLLISRMIAQNYYTYNVFIGSIMHVIVEFLVYTHILYTHRSPYSLSTNNIREMSTIYLVIFTLLSIIQIK